MGIVEYIHYTYEIVTKLALATFDAFVELTYQLYGKSILISPES